MAGGWKSRGYLPHCDERGLVQHIVFGLNDGFRSTPPTVADPTQRAKWAEKEFDAGHGSRLLAQPQIAAIVEDCLLFGDGERYALAAWCVMPTHVHVLAEQIDGRPLGSVLQRWKSFTAHAINKSAGRTDALWQREYFDRFMRSEQQFVWTVAYIENNPVAAGLTQRPEGWRFSSARWRRNVAGEDAGAP